MVTHSKICTYDQMLDFLTHLSKDGRLFFRSIPWINKIGTLVLDLGLKWKGISSMSMWSMIHVKFVVGLVQSCLQDVLTLNHWQDRMVWNMKSFDLLINDFFRNLDYRHKRSQLHIRRSKGYLCSCILAICFEILIEYARFYYET